LADLTAAVHGQDGRVGVVIKEFDPITTTDIDLLNSARCDSDLLVALINEGATPAGDRPKMLEAVGVVDIVAVLPEGEDLGEVLALINPSVVWCSNTVLDSETAEALQEAGVTLYDTKLQK